MQPAILLVRSDYQGWAGLRQSLKGDRRLHLIGETRDAGEAARLAAERRPDAMLIPAAPTDIGAIALVDRLQGAHRAGKIIVIGEDALLDGDLLVELWACKVPACLLWEGLRLEAAHHAVALVLDGGVVASAVLLERMLAALARRGWPHAEGEGAAPAPYGGGVTQEEAPDALSSLTERERAVAATSAWTTGAWPDADLPPANPRRQPSTRARALSKPATAVAWQRTPTVVGDSLGRGVRAAIGLAPQCPCAAMRPQSQAHCRRPTRGDSHQRALVGATPR